VYRSDKSLLKDELAKAQDFIETQEAEMLDLKEKLRDAEAAISRSYSDRYET
jgi:hypothetical protein